MKYNDDAQEMEDTSSSDVEVIEIENASVITSPFPAPIKVEPKTPLLKRQPQKVRTTCMFYRFFDIINFRYSSLQCV